VARALNGSTQYLANASPVVTAVPCTLAAWFWTANTSVSEYLISVDNGGDNRFALNVNGSVRAITTDGASKIATSSATYTASTWQHAAAVFSAVDSRAALLNGGNKGTDASSARPLGISQTQLGRTYATSNLTGNLAHAAIWSAALTDAEVASLYNNGIGLDPRLIRPDALVAYWPLLNADGDVDWWGQYDLTAYNTPTYAAAPPLLMPSGLRTVVYGGGGAAGRTGDISQTLPQWVA